jgi:hypothetical protein
MKGSILSIVLAVFLAQGTALAQYRGFTDRFDDDALTLPRGSREPNPAPHVVWSTLSPGTYRLIEADGVLKIEYSKVKGTGTFDCFTLTPPYPVTANGNPHIQLKIKTPVDIRLSLRPYYSFKPPTYEELGEDIPGDGRWHTYTFRLYDYLVKRCGIQLVEFYLDHGTDQDAQAEILLDDVRIGWHEPQVRDLTAAAVHGTNIRLTWSTGNPGEVSLYKVYRGTEPQFACTDQSLIGESQRPEYTDRNLGAYKLFYYRVMPMGHDGEAALPSAALRAETHAEGEVPGVRIGYVNTSSVGKYEKFELQLSLSNVGIHNPFDPEDIDVYAQLVAPDGRKVRINAFYDNYLGADAWKLRFSPNQTGEWSYQVFVRDAGGTGSSEKRSFTCVPSGHHGWIRPSEKNPHYFAHDDGSSYYAVGVYSPWRNDESRFRTFAEHNANLFAIWDINYGGFVNETGVIEHELGKYNQEKCGRIDSLLAILEASDIMLMYAIWPHDLFSKTVWAAQWDLNPYSQITDVVDIYSDELAWEYQKKKYRYMIARFGHSRSMGIWELINEMNGTDGWKENRHQDAFNWVERAVHFFAENDPYRHPVTASFSGGYDQYRPALHERIDLPNLHLYESQGWPMRYPEDTLRSSMYNYAFAARRFRERFEKPAIFGEAGAEHTYFRRGDPRNHEAYHNAIWASLSNGLAGTPVWWDYTFLSAQDWRHLSYLAGFVRDIDFANLDYRPGEFSGEELDVYGMMATGTGFGWARAHSGAGISGKSFTIRLPDGKYQVVWFDTWTGREAKTEAIATDTGLLLIKAPVLPDERPDVAFKIHVVH